MLRADELARSAPRKGWQRLSAGRGSKGHRLCDWLLLDPGAQEHQLVVRRSISKPAELAYYICHTYHPVSLAELVRVAGSRWAVEETFQLAKNETGLDHYQVRKYDAWYRHITLSMLAAAFLAFTAHTERTRDQKGHQNPENDLIPLSCNEIRRLWATLTHPTHPQTHTDHWLDWRRHHWTARRSHRCTVVRSIPSVAANCSWVKPMFLRRSARCDRLRATRVPLPMVPGRSRCRCPRRSRRSMRHGCRMTAADRRWSALAITGCVQVATLRDIIATKETARTTSPDPASLPVRRL